MLFFRILWLLRPNDAGLSPPKNMHRNVWDIYLWKCRKCVVIRFFFFFNIFLKFAIRLVVVKDSAVWSLNIFENFKKLVQKIQTNNSKQSSETQTWTEQCFIRSLKYKLNLFEKNPFGRTNPQKPNFVIRCCPWISEKKSVRQNEPSKT